MKTTTILEKKDLELEQKETAGLEKVTLSISEDGAEHLIGTLTNLYSKPVESVFREIISNALDAHVRAGQSDAIDVTVNNSSFIVRDYGHGMDKAEITDIYSKYGSSTKRDTNTQIGAFGLGAKSPLAITDRFDVVSIKNGQKIKFYIKKNMKGVGVIHFLGEPEKTNDPDGVLITIPIESNTHREAFSRLLKEDNWFLTWNPALIRLNGAPLDVENTVYNTKKWIEIVDANDTLGWVQRDPRSRYHHHNPSNGMPRIAISGIRYEIGASPDQATHALEQYVPKEHYEFATNVLRAGFEIILNLPVDAVDLTPARESIMMTKKTSTALKTRFASILTSITYAFQSELNAQPTKKDALAFFIKNAAVLGVPNQGNIRNNNYYATYIPEVPALNRDGSGAVFDVKYKGEPIPLAVPLKAFVMESRNATSWAPKWDSVLTANVIRFFNKVPNKSHGGYNIFQSLDYMTKYTHIVVYGDYNEDNCKLVLRNARSYARGTEGGKYPIVHFVNSNTKPTNPWLEAVVPVLSVKELAEQGLEFRREENKLREKTRVAKPRSEAIQYGVFKENGVSVARRLTNQDLAAFNRIVLVPEETNVRIDHKAPFKNILGRWDYNYALSAQLWKDIPLVYGAGEKTVKPVDLGTTTRNLEVIQLINVVSAVFPDDLVLFLPKNRAVGPIEKAATGKVLTLRQAVIEELKKLNKSKKKLAIAAFLSRAELTPLGSARTVNAPNSLGTIQPDKIENETVREAIQEVRNKGAIFGLLGLMRNFIFIPATETRSKDGLFFTDYAAILEAQPTSKIAARFDFVQTSRPSVFDARYTMSNLDEEDMMIDIVNRITRD